MSPFWNNFLWCVAGIIGGAIVSVIIFHATKTKKKLSYHIESTFLITESLSAVDNLKITQDGKEIKDLTLSTVRLINTGNTDITLSDFPELGKPHIVTTGSFIKASYNSKFIQASNPANAPFVKIANDQLINIDFDYIGKGDSIIIPIYHTGKIKFGGLLRNGKVYVSGAPVPAYVDLVFDLAFDIAEMITGIRLPRIGK